MPTVPGNGQTKFARWWYGVMVVVCKPILVFSLAQAKQIGYENWMKGNFQQRAIS